VPAAVLRERGWAPGTVLEWEIDGDNVLLRRVGDYSSEDIHRAIFRAVPRRRKLAELKRGIREHISARRARR